MRKFIAGVIVGTIMATVGFTSAASQIRLVVNGREVISDVPPQIISGRTMVPARFLAEALGASVAWNGETQTVIIASHATASIPDGYAVVTDLAKGGAEIRSEGRTLIITGPNGSVTFPLDSHHAGALAAVSSTGFAVRGWMDNARLYVNYEDAKIAGLLE